MQLSVAVMVIVVIPGILFLATAGLVLAQVVDPATAEQIVGMIAGIVM